MEKILSKRYAEEEIDEMVEEYKCKFGGGNNWEKHGRSKYIVVQRALVEYDSEEGQLSIGGDVNTALTMFRILQVKKEVKQERDLLYLGKLPEKTCIHGCCNYESE